jgi:hypothetical protein
LSANFFIANLWVATSTSGRKFLVLVVGAYQIDHRNQARVACDLDDLLVSQSPQGKIGAVRHDMAAHEADRDVAIAGADAFLVAVH